MNEKQEQIYIQGSRAAWLRMLHTCLIELGIDDPEAGKSRWVLEREATVAALRGVCENHGDNDWDENLHLADVIEKHLERHLIVTPLTRQPVEYNVIIESYGGGSPGPGGASNVVWPGGGGGGNRGW